METAITDIYNGYPKLKSAFKFWSDRETMFLAISQQQHYMITLQPIFNRSNHPEVFL